jgi:hypothetical protein
MIPRLTFIFFIVDFVLARGFNHFFKLGVGQPPLHPNDNGFIHFVADDDARHGFSLDRTFQR